MEKKVCQKARPIFILPLCLPPFSLHNIYLAYAYNVSVSQIDRRWHNKARPKTAKNRANDGLEKTSRGIFDCADPKLCFAEHHRRFGNYTVFIRVVPAVPFGCFMVRGCTRDSIRLDRVLRPLDALTWLVVFVAGDRDMNWWKI
ncbi:MAG TPA: hypothetical protein VMW83_09705 [Spirochaetia bacterium]|nr:hypothetical protein [Spirochaetia bacterium]